ncbi:hypothetical protein EYF80_015607 [Liparis tanakae]|uniref:Uncharacterized protein n=1 Tax=Liparis tanakae TaxID=230148 RepID=A0A4Z2I9T9_9TELE|nr:hypothetical protein EYF80_015607 [Liparis tanakae]
MLVPSARGGSVISVCHVTIALPVESPALRTDWWATIEPSQFTSDRNTFSGTLESSRQLQKRLGTRERLKEEHRHRFYRELGLVALGAGVSARSPGPHEGPGLQRSGACLVIREALSYKCGQRKDAT